MGILTLPFGPISEILYLRDYWHPQYLVNIFGFGIEDLLFAFLIGGIGVVIYEDLFIKRMRRGKREHSEFIAILGLISLLIVVVLTFSLKINSIYATSIVMILMAIIIITKRHDLLKNAFANGILVSLVMFIFYFIWTRIFPNIIQSWWDLNNISGIIFFGAPLEELLWGFAWGFLACPLYEFWKDLHDK